MGTSLIKTLLRSKQTAFSLKDVAMLTRNTNANSLKARIHYYVKQGELYPVRQGIYAKDKDYNHLEVATKIFIPAYISFETVFAQEGMIFQVYNSIFVATHRSEKVACDGQRYIFRTLQPRILTNPSGVRKTELYSIASPERAFLDMLYIRKDYHFDSLSPLSWAKVYTILTIYENKRLDRTVKKKHNQYIKLL